jgi:hypothetical protein
MVVQLGATSSPATAYFAVNAIVLAWDLYVAARIVNNRRGSPIFLGLSALAALLAVPAVVVAAASSSVLNGRAIYIIEWIWPLVLAICALQAALAVARGWTTPFLGVPVLVCNVVLCAAATMRFTSTLVVDPPPVLMALSAAHANVLGFVFGRGALVSSVALQVPALAPSYPSRFRIGKTVRAGLALWTAATATLFAAEYPRAVHASSSFAAFSSQRIQERPRGDFVIGVRVFPDLHEPPSPRAVSEDFAVADSLDANALSVVLIPPGGVTQLTLDSLSRTLEDMRSDSTLLVVALGYGSGDGQLRRRNSDAYVRTRLRELDLVVRRLRPDILFPALDPLLAGASALGDVPVRWWRAYLSEAAALVHRVRPATQVGVAVSAYTSPDSELFAWASAAESPIDVLGFTLYASYGGGSSLVARFHAAERAIQGTGKPVWVTVRGAPPRIFGERNQERALWGALAWATTQPRVTGFIVDGAGDYDVLTGLRAAGGRLRPVVAKLAAAKRTLAEARTGR